MRKYPHLTVHVSHNSIQQPTCQKWDLPMEPGQSACACSPGRRVSVAGLGAAAPLPGRAGQDDSYPAAQAQEQPHGSLQLTQSIYTRETGALCWPSFNTAAQSPDGSTLKLLSEEDI